MKNKSYKVILFVSLTCWMLSACNTDVNNVVTPGDKPIVAAYLVANQPVNINITTEIPYTVNDSVGATPIDNLSLVITDNLGNKFALKSIGKGNYQSGTKELIKEGRTYSLGFTYNGKNISANTTIPSKTKSLAEDRQSITRTQIDLSSGIFKGGGNTDDQTPVTLTWLNPTNDYYFVVADNLEISPIPVVILPNTTTGTEITQITRRFRQQPVQGITTGIRPQSFQYYGKYRIILFHVNADYAALYQSNGTTTQNITTPPSYITNGLGLFTGVNADTLSFSVLKP